jgi:hypothetical protein
MSKNNTTNIKREEATLSPTLKRIESVGLFVEKGVTLGSYRGSFPLGSCK